MKKAQGLFNIFFDQGLVEHNGEMESIFTQIFHKHTWGGISRSGTGSDCVQTAFIQKELPQLFKKYGCSRIADAPCGDFFWMQHVPVEYYCGADVVEPLIEQNKTLYAHQKRHFIHLDITKEVLPAVDLILCRDALVHFSYGDIGNAIFRFKQSGSTYLLTTSYTGSHHKDLNIPMSTGGWRPLNLCKEPFCFPDPLEIICEHSTENPLHADKSLFLWRLADIF